MGTRKYRYFVGDFETTVYDGQKDTEVWASACVELNTEDVNIFHSISEQFKYFKSLKCNVVCYYHNLKFDGAFWLSYLLTDLKYKQAFIHGEDGKTEKISEKDMNNKTFSYSISDRGQWYTITIKVGGNYIVLRDSLKLLPFSVRRIGKSFKTKHQKLDMEYKGERYAGCTITDKEKEYIANDVLVVKEAIEMMFSEGHNKLTIGACCLSEYKKICKKSLKNQLSYDEMFPALTDMHLEKAEYEVENADEYIRKSYKGGWCYLVKGKENKVKYNGTTADVNSLYPSMMSSESGNKYPIGTPYFWKGENIPDIAIGKNKYFFVKIKTRFYLKEGMLPFLQIKGNALYKGTEALESSDVYDSKTGEYYTHWTDKKGKVHDTRVELTLTMTDYDLLKEHYELVDFEIISGCWFYTQTGIFDEYIEKYKKIKMTSKGAKRELAKLFLNNLYGKMASSTDSSYKVAYEKEDGAIGFYSVLENEKKAGYIAVGSAITSYARNFTIRAAQKNFHGIDKPGFIYADTDSIHCDLQPDEIKGIRVDDREFCCWKLESCWDTAIFTRQKTYIEHIVKENLEEIENPYYNIKCAGMPDRCKNLFDISMQGTADISGYVSRETNEHKDWTIAEKNFLFDGITPIKRTLSDFKIGLKVPGKLMPRRIKGGILLKETTYEMR